MNKPFQLIKYSFILLGLACSSYNQETDKEITFKNVKIEINRTDKLDILISDVVADTIIIKLSSLDCKKLKFYDLDGRLIYLCDNNKTKDVWEIETELGRVMQLDLTEDNLESLKEIK